MTTIATTSSIAGTAAAKTSFEDKTDDDDFDDWGSSSINTAGFASIGYYDKGDDFEGWRSSNISKCCWCWFYFY